MDPRLPRHKLDPFLLIDRASGARYVDPARTMPRPEPGDAGLVLTVTTSPHGEPRITWQPGATQAVLVGIVHEPATEAHQTAWAAVDGLLPTTPPGGYLIVSTAPQAGATLPTGIAPDTTINPGDWLVAVDANHDGTADSWHLVTMPAPTGLPPWGTAGQHLAVNPQANGAVWVDPPDGVVSVVAAAHAPTTWAELVGPTPHATELGHYQRHTSAGTPGWFSFLSGHVFVNEQNLAGQPSLHLTGGQRLRFVDPLNAARWTEYPVTAVLGAAGTSWHYTVDMNAGVNAPGGGFVPSSTQETILARVAGGPAPGLQPNWAWVVGEAVQPYPGLTGIGVTPQPGDIIYTIDRDGDGVPDEFALVSNGQGTQGPPGPQGPMGAAVSIQGSVGTGGFADWAAAAAAKAFAQGDAYIVTTLGLAGEPTVVNAATDPIAPGDLIFFDGTSWHNAGKIVGPQGPPGPAGTGADRPAVTVSAVAGRTPLDATGSLFAEVPLEQPGAVGLTTNDLRLTVGARLIGEWVATNTMAGPGDLHIDQLALMTLHPIDSTGVDRSAEIASLAPGVTLTITEVGGPQASSNVQVLGPAVLPVLAGRRDDEYVNTADRRNWVHDGTRWVERAHPHPLGLMTFSRVIGDHPEKHTWAVPPQPGDIFIAGYDDKQWIARPAQWDTSKGVEWQPMFHAWREVFVTRRPQAGDEVVTFAEVDGSPWSGFRIGEPFVVREVTAGHLPTMTGRLAPLSGKAAEAGDWIVPLDLNGDLAADTVVLVRHESARHDVTATSVAKRTPLTAGTSAPIGPAGSGSQYRPMQNEPGGNGNVGIYEVGGQLRIEFWPMAHDNTTNPTATLLALPAGAGIRLTSIIVQTDHSDGTYVITAPFQVDTTVGRHNVVWAPVTALTPVTDWNSNYHNVQVLTPVAGKLGDEFVNTEDKRSWVHDGVSWIERQHPTQPPGFVAISGGGGGDTLSAAEMFTPTVFKPGMVGVVTAGVTVPALPAGHTISGAVVGEILPEGTIVNLDGTQYKFWKAQHGTVLVANEAARLALTTPPHTLPDGTLVVQQDTGWTWRYQASYASDAFWSPWRVFSDYVGAPDIAARNALAPHIHIGTLVSVGDQMYQYEANPNTAAGQPPGVFRPFGQHVHLTEPAEKAGVTYFDRGLVALGMNTANDATATGATISGAWEISITGQCRSDTDLYLILHTPNMGGYPADSPMRTRDGKRAIGPWNVKSQAPWTIKIVGGISGWALWEATFSGQDPTGKRIFDMVSLSDTLGVGTLPVFGVDAAAGNIRFGKVWVKHFRESA